jgi:hypothetical protein
MNIGSLNKSVVQFVLLLISLACVFIIILGIQSSAYIINSILLAAMITLAVLPVPRKLIRRGGQVSLDGYCIGNNLPKIIRIRLGIPFVFGVHYANNFI